MRIINFKTSYEDIISRIPGLFAYVQNGEIHKATDSPMGCYGKIIENIKYQSNVDLMFNGSILLHNGNTYTFKTLIELYYKYKNYKIDELTNEIIDENGNVIYGFNDLRNFIEKGIGQVKVDIEKSQEADIVPEFIYLIQAQSLYNEMYNLKVICNLYETHIKNKTEIDKETEIDMCCKCKLYRRKGGDNMLTYLERKIEECNKVALEYYEYVDKENGLKFDYNINLFSSDKDLGIVSPLDELDDKIQNKQILNENGNDYFEQTFNTNSKLKSLRKRKKYYNAWDEEETPNSNEDWLYFYRICNITNISVLNDSLGNIQTENTDLQYVDIDKEILDLYAYGDLIEKIELSKATLEKYGITEKETSCPCNINTENNESDFDNMINAFKITYWTDVHLKAKVSEIKVDDDGNKLVFFNKFEPDYWYCTGCNEENEEKNYHGIKYEEIYFFDDDSEIVDLIKANEFYEYIKGEFDVDDENKGQLKMFEKYVFSTYNNTMTRNKQLSEKRVEFNDIISNATVRITQYQDLDYEYYKFINNNDIVHINEINPNEINRHEFYEGISFTPTEEFNVYIDRGTTSIFDKHIRFGEIKTLQDMEEFSNGSFFNLQE